jgi:hypothetical protein
VAEASLSLDGQRLELIVDSCNAEIETSVEETSDTVEVSVVRSDGSTLQLAGGSCQDLTLIELNRRLGNRVVVDEATGSTVEVARPNREQVEWPYDQDRVSNAQYVEALHDMVECLETRDPQMDAWVAQDLNWKTYRWSKPPDAEGNMSVPALEPCMRKHLAPLT